MMAVPELSTDQVVTLFKQLPQDRRKEALLALAVDSSQDFKRAQTEAEQAVSRLAAERGLVWDSLSEEARLSFIDDLVSPE